MPADLRQCDACGKPVPGNLTPEPHDCGHGQRCKPKSHPETCARCRQDRIDQAVSNLIRVGWTREDTLTVARKLGIELVKNG